jgi:ubiquinone/menaquinone biosynthesis C-methylase UbiE
VPDRRDNWDRLARVYDWQLPLERPTLRALLELLDVGETERLLDVGTGTAALLRELARRPRPPERAIGLDSSAEMLARAGELPPGWELVRGAAESLPFENGNFDVATAAYLFHTLNQDARASILAELRRVVRPGGRVGVVTVAPPRTRLAVWLSWPIRAAARRSGGVLVGLRPLDPVPELVTSGFHVTARRRVALGYPSLCVVARRD